MRCQVMVEPAQAHFPRLSPGGGPRAPKDLSAPLLGVPLTLAPVVKNSHRPIK